MPPTPFQAWFDAARVTHGLSLREVASKVGVPAAAVAGEPGTTLEVAVREASSIALAIMEQRASR
jgi:hypothetical protein